MGWKLKWKLQWSYWKRTPMRSRTHSLPSASSWKKSKRSTCRCSTKFRWELALCPHPAWVPAVACSMELSPTASPSCRGRESAHQWGPSVLGPLPCHNIYFIWVSQQTPRKVYKMGKVSKIGLNWVGAYGALTVSLLPVPSAPEGDCWRSGLRIEVCFVFSSLPNLQATQGAVYCSPHLLFQCVEGSQPRKNLLG